MLRKAFLGWLGVIALAACRASIPSGVFSCPDGNCPPGLTCRNERCVDPQQTGASSEERDAAPPDAGEDAAPPAAADSGPTPNACGTDTECIACERAADCPSRDCSAAECTDRRCSWTPEAKGTACGDGQVCTGSGKCAQCVPGSRRCVPGSAIKRQRCSDEGQWRNEADCSGQACIDGECRGEC